MKHISAFNESLDSSNIIVGKSSFEDPRDGRVYQTVILDNGDEKVEWFAENLDYNDYDDYGGESALDIFFTKREIPSLKEDYNRKVCGRYYRFNSLKNACPEGWEIPERKEFINLFKKITNLPPHVWRDAEKWKITESLCGIGSILELTDCGRYEMPLAYTVGTSSFAGNKPKADDFLFSGEDGGYYWSRTPGALSNGASVFIFTKKYRTFKEEVGYGYYTVRPIRKNI
jgi:uncharacterized protein (TIGR02145 family)